MQLEAGELNEFYQTAMGRRARGAILHRIKGIWPDVRSLRVLGFGYSIPYLSSWLAEAERTVAIMPAQQGVVAWPRTKCLTALSEETALPFDDAMFDRILVVHGLEAADSARPLLRQLWRVMAAEGKLLLVAPNRASLWAQLVYSPFAQGQPYHRLELSSLLKGALFEPTRWDRALHHPPLRGKRLMGTGTTLESFGRRTWPALAGVHIVEATKSLSAPLREPARIRGRRIFAPISAAT
ncbi:MAG: methyltransferase type 11 [Alphaproteobacteria bacterium]|nr:methyltransferase type 11 [Alphaproteobacteria bacterium]